MEARHGKERSKSLGLRTALLGERPNVVRTLPLHRIAGVGVAQHAQLDFRCRVHDLIISPISE